MNTWNNAKQRALTKERNSPIKSLFFSLTVVEYVVFDRKNFNDMLHKHTSPLRTHVESEHLTTRVYFSLLVVVVDF